MAGGGAEILRGALIFVKLAMEGRIFLASCRLGAFFGCDIFVKPAKPIFPRLG